MGSSALISTPSSHTDAPVGVTRSRNDAVALSWQILEPVLGAWHATRVSAPFPNYAAGSWGPAEADALLARGGRAWKNSTALPRFKME